MKESYEWVYIPKLKDAALIIDEDTGSYRFEGAWTRLLRKKENKHDNTETKGVAQTK